LPAAPSSTPPSTARVSPWREVVLFVALLGLCPIAAQLAPADGAEPVATANAVVSLERSIGLFFEPAVHAWLAARPDLLTAAGAFYLWAHVPVTGGALLLLLLHRPERLRPVRTLFAVAQVLTVATYLLLPMAPPRLLDTGDFSDTLSGVWGRGAADAAHLLQSPYAAMPSGHVVFALVSAVALAALTRHVLARLLCVVYPLAVVAVTIATANHFWLDAAGAVVVVGLAAALAAPIVRFEEGARPLLSGRPRWARPPAARRSASAGRAAREPLPQRQ